MREYIVIKNNAGQILALDPEYSVPMKDCKAAMVVEARNRAEAGAKFALECLLDQDALRVLITAYLESIDFDLTKLEDDRLGRPIVTMQQLKNLDRLLEGSVLDSVLKKVELVKEES